MFRLKEYQQRTLDALAGYLGECSRLDDADTAFYQMTRRTYTLVTALPGLPYVCLRIPTGGGKTLVACHAVGVAARELLQTENIVVLWLVPSNAIREQTLAALKNHEHPYRQALTETVSDLTILDIDEALSAQPHTLNNSTTIIVSTMQAFRVEDTEGRKVYESAGALKGHFADLPAETLSGIQRHADGEPISSLANVLWVHRPVVIMDEAHNARTELSFDTLARFNPSGIIEFTATPDTKKSPSNVLHTISAAELHAEDMIKMPIQLETKPDWKELLADAIGQRDYLEQSAKMEHQENGEYIRPIMLIQAQPRRKGTQTLTVDVVEECLMTDFKVPAAQIVRATGSEKGLEGVDLADPDCPVRFVITVQALREGWDCPLAYVLCSVAEMRSSTAVEQILGRVMRLPNVTRKAHEDLNKAYAFAASRNFFEVARALTEALVQNGFERQEAKDLIVPESWIQEDLKLFDPPPKVTISLPEIPAMSNLTPSLARKIKIDTKEKKLSISGALDEQEWAALENSCSTSEGQAAVREARRQYRSIQAKEKQTPSERGETFEVPVLAVKQGDLFEPFEETHFLEYPWNLSECDASLSEAEFAENRDTGQHGEIRVTESGRLKTSFLGELHQQMTLLAEDQGWSVANLAHWLDREIKHPDIDPAESGVFLTRLLRYFIEVRGFTLDDLVHDKYRLKKAAETKINQHRQAAHQSAYQTLLLPECETPLVVSPEVCFSFDPIHYPYNTRYNGYYQFRKHYYPYIGDLKSEGEEHQCAQYIDSLHEVNVWARNLERRPSHAFWLQTSTDRFYPDFVCRLSDGRYLVVEYKGEHLWTNEDSRENRDIGGLWGDRSDGKCLFIMPRGKDFEAIRAKIHE